MKKQIKEKKKSRNIPNEKEITLAFNLNGLGIRRFTFVEPGLDIIKYFNDEKLKIGLNFDLATDKEKNTITIIWYIVYQYNLIEKEILLIDFVLATNFVIKDFSSVVKIEKKDFTIPDELLITFVSLSYSAARGILFAKTQGSFLNQFVLPIIDPSVVVEQKKANHNISQNEEIQK